MIHRSWTQQSIARKRRVSAMMMMVSRGTRMTTTTTMKRTKLLSTAAVFLLGASTCIQAFTITTPGASPQKHHRRNHDELRQLLGVPHQKSVGFSPTVTATAPLASSSTSETAGAADASSMPKTTMVLDGKRILPYKILLPSLKAETEPIPAVYAVMSAEYKRGSSATESWAVTEYVGVTQNLFKALQHHKDQPDTATKVAHIRAMTFPFPQPTAMQELAQEWRDMAVKAGATAVIDNQAQWTGTETNAMDYLYDEDDEDDDDEEDEEFLAMTAEAMAMAREPAQPETVVSPFAENEAGTGESTDAAIPFTSANVDKVLDEVRPYLIQDGGDVTVTRVDEEKQDVYLKLEGACGSCASSTVTMQMGIERVLKENFPNLGQVLQVESDPQAQPTELTMEVVEEEVGRLRPAIIAMGGVVRVLSINDPEPGVVQLEFQGASRVQQGLELALLDLPFVEKVECVPPP